MTAAQRERLVVQYWKRARESRCQHDVWFELSATLHGIHLEMRWGPLRDEMAFLSSLALFRACV